MKDDLSTENDLIKSVNKMKREKPKGFGVRISDAVSDTNPPAIAVKDSAAETEQPKQDSHSEVSSPTPQPQADTVNLEAMIQNALASALSPLQNQLAQSQQREQDTAKKVEELTTQLQTAQSQLSAAQKDSQTLNDLGRLTGTSSIQMPNVNLATSTSDSPTGLIKDLVDILNDSERSKIHRNVRDNATNVYATQRDPSAASQVIQASFREARSRGLSWRDSAIIKDAESFFKKGGLLGGRVADAAGPTTGTTAPPLYLDILSSLMRETHQAVNVFWQFPMVVYDPSTAPGKNALIPRWANLDEPTSLADYLIASTNVYNPIPGVIGTSTDSQSLEVSSVPVGIFQYGLGRGTAVGTRPVFIPEFHEATSLLSLIDAVDSRLMQNYYRFEDLMIRSEFLKATTVYYNDGGNVTVTPGDVAAGNDGTMSRTFLNTVYSQMFASRIPTLPDGCYVLVLNPTSANQLKISLDSLYAIPTPEQVSQAMATFRMASGVEMGQLTNYMGNFCNFHCFVTNSMGVGAVDNVTVFNTTFGAGATVTADSLAFGVGAVGRGIAQAVEVRSEVSPFQLGEAFIWTSREGCTAVDVDASSTAPVGQQTRTVRLRTGRVAV